MAKVIFENKSEYIVKNLIVWKKSGKPVSGIEMSLILMIISIISFIAGVLTGRGL